MARLSTLILVLLIGCAAPPEDSAERVDVGTFVDVGADSALGVDAENTQDAEIWQDLGAAPRTSVFERGPYNVGHRRFDITYDAVLESGRTIKLSVWYPTTDDEGLPGLYLVNWQRREVFRDATVAIDGQAPLLVFSHGNTSLAEQSYFMTEFWASHGWVVVAPYHTGNTVLSAGTAGGISLEAAPLRPQDITATLDAVYALAAPDPLAGKVSDEVVLSGHSFGGFTTLASTGAEFAVDTIVQICAEANAPAECEMLERDGVEALFRGGFLDERIDVAIPQAPGGFFVFLDGISAIGVPTLLFTGARDQTLPAGREGNPIWAAMTGRDMRVDVRNAGHFTFSNMCELLPVGPVLDDGCASDFIPVDLAFELVNAYSLAFARHILWSDAAAANLLFGDDDRYASEVQLSWKSEFN